MVLMNLKMMYNFSIQIENAYFCDNIRSVYNFLIYKCNYPAVIIYEWTIAIILQRHL